MRKAGWIVVLLIVVTAVWCGQPRHRYGKVYQGADKKYYTRQRPVQGHADVWWVYSVTSDSGTCCSGGAWSKAPAPATMTPTGRVVEEEEDDEPSNEAEAESAETAAGEVTADSPADAADASGGDAGGSDGGGDSGGGDGGGGGE